MLITCQQFIEILHLQLLGPTEDYVGLYEQYWAIPDGDRYDVILDLKKKYDFELVLRINELLFEKGYIEILFVANGAKTPILSKRILYDRENWKPFSISSGPGYVIAATNKGSNLAAMLSRKYGVPGL